MKKITFPTLKSKSPLYLKATRLPDTRASSYRKVVLSKAHQTELYFVESFYKPVSLIIRLKPE